MSMNREFELGLSHAVESGVTRWLREPLYEVQRLIAETRQLRELHRP